MPDFKFAIAIIASIFCNSSLGGTPCSTAPSKPMPFVNLQETIDQKIQTFANHRAIAPKADELLAKLIKAKSPVLNAWMNKRQFQTKSEDEVIRAWRVYFARNFVLTEYPQKDLAVNAEVEKLANEILEEFSKNISKSKMETLFDQAKVASLSAIQGFPIDEATKKQIVTRIQAVKLYWIKDFKSARNNSIPLDILDWGIAYDPVPNEINMGIAALSYPNDETYLSVFAHEIGHSIDSCRWGAFMKGPWPFDKIGGCLRTAESAAAKKRDDSQLEKLSKAGKLNAELVKSLRDNPTCNKLVYPPVGVQADQLPESFADWFSAEAMAQIKDLKVENLRTDLCEDKPVSATSSYPTNSQRLSAIYFSQPVLNAKIKNKSQPTMKHCYF